MPEPTPILSSAVPGPAVPHPARPYVVGILIGLSAAFLFCGYELVRSPTNTLFKAAYGKAALPYVMAATPVGVVVLLYIYGRLLTWLGPRWTLVTTTIGSCAILAGSYGAIAAGWNLAAAILYIVREAYIVLLMEQYWSFLNSTLGEANARRLNGPICGIGSGGSIIGGILVGTLATKVGTPALLLLALQSPCPRRCSPGSPIDMAVSPNPVPMNPTATPWARACSSASRSSPFFWVSFC